MRYILGLVMLACVMPVCGQNYNESVAAISFNPSRTGAYEYLKIIKNAKLPGGIDACAKQEAAQCQTAATVSSQGTVSVRAEAADSLGYIKVIEPQSTDTPQTNLETQNGSLVRGKKAQNAAGEEAFTAAYNNTWKKEWTPDWNESTQNTFADYGTTVIVKKGATLSAQNNSKVFVGTLQLSSDADRLIVKMNQGNLTNPINASKLTLGGGALPLKEKALNGFEWKNFGDEDSTQILYVK